MPDALICPCGSGHEYRQCCAPYLTWQVPAATAEQLMRSRYTAYVMRDKDYLLATWHASTRPAQLQLETDVPTSWLGLKIVATIAGKAQDSDGMVEFIARYKLNGKAHRLHEESRFVREQGRWLYVSGTIRHGS